MSVGFAVGGLRTIADVNSFNGKSTFWEITLPEGLLAESMGYSYTDGHTVGSVGGSVGPSIAIGHYGMTYSTPIMQYDKNGVYIMPEIHGMLSYFWSHTSGGKKWTS